MDRPGYNYVQKIPSRWMDNDVYGHVNNVHYYSYFDTVINTYLIMQAGLDIHGSGPIGLCAESHCRFLAPLVFPETIEAALKVDRLGQSSVRYAIGLFSEAKAEAAAQGWFVHVFVDRHTRRPVPIDGAMRAALEALLAPPQEEANP